VRVNNLRYRWETVLTFSADLLSVVLVTVLGTVLVIMSVVVIIKGVVGMKAAVVTSMIGVKVLISSLYGSVDMPRLVKYPPVASVLNSSVVCPKSSYLAAKIRLVCIRYTNRITEQNYRKAGWVSEWKTMVGGGGREGGRGGGRGRGGGGGGGGGGEGELTYNIQHNLSGSYVSGLFHHRFTDIDTRILLKDSGDNEN